VTTVRSTVIDLSTVTGLSTVVGRYYTKLDMDSEALTVKEELNVPLYLLPVWLLSSYKSV
jgi:hypothetical protein